MERSAGFKVRRWSYHRLPGTMTPAWPVAARGVRLGRRRPALLGSTARRFGRRLRAKARWSPLQLLGRIVDAYLNSVLPWSLKIVSSAVAPRRGGAPRPTKLRRAAASKHGEIDGRGVKLNFCVAEVLRRSSSEVRRSPLRPRKEATPTVC